jgi:hypothetical protein
MSCSRSTDRTRELIIDKTLEFGRDRYFEKVDERISGSETSHVATASGRECGDVQLKNWEQRFSTISQTLRSS